MKSFALAAIAALASAVSVEAEAATVEPLVLTGPRQYIPRYLVNRLSEQYTDNDYRFAACTIRRVPIPNVFIYLEEFWMHGHVYVEQTYAGGEWQAPDAYINLENLSRSGVNSQYTINTHFIGNYDPLTCTTKDATV